MSATKEYLAQAIDAWVNDGVAIPNDVALHLIEELYLVNKTRGGVRAVRDSAQYADTKAAADAVFGWMIENKVRQITAEVYDHLRAEYARAQNARAEKASNAASLTLPDVQIDTCMTHATDADEHTLVVQIGTSRRLAVYLNDGRLYDGDPNTDGVIPVPQALLAELYGVYCTSAGGYRDQPRAIQLNALFQLYKEATS